jgi:hypothetical protein
LSGAHSVEKSKDVVYPTEVMMLRLARVRLIFLVLLIAISSLTWALEPTSDPTTEFLEKFISYNQKQLKLAEVRADLEDRLLKFAERGGRPYGDDIIVDIQGLTSVKTQKARVAQYMEELKGRQNAIESAKQELGRADRPQKGLPPLISNFLASKEARSVKIDAKDCLGSLERMSKASKAIDVDEATTSRLSAVRDGLIANTTSSSSPLAVLSLLDATFECERAMLEAKFDSWIQPSAMAHCFSAIALKQQEVSGPIALDSHRSAKVFIDTQSFVAPSAESLKKYESGHEAELVSYVMDQPTASVTPADVFRRALSLAKGDLYVALRMAFSVLRANRTHLDFQRKLIDLRGDRASGGRNGGDWYHFFGAMLVRQVYWSWVVKVGMESDNPSKDDKKKYTNFAGVKTWEILVKDLEEGRASTESERELCRLDRQLGPRDPSVPTSVLPSLTTPVRNRSTSQ